MVAADFHNSRYVFLDPDGSQGVGLLLIVLAQTGVEYAHQCGGFACETRSAEGFMIPLGPSTPIGSGAPDSKLSAFFEASFQGWPPPSSEGWTEDRLHRLAELIGEVVCWRTTRSIKDDRRERLRLDTSRLHDCTEAWIPVVSPFGPGILVFDNSD